MPSFLPLTLMGTICFGIICQTESLTALCKRGIYFANLGIFRIYTLNQQNNWEPARCHKKLRCSNIIFIAFNEKKGYLASILGKRLKSRLMPGACFKPVVSTNHDANTSWHPHGVKFHATNPTFKKLHLTANFCDALTNAWSLSFTL
jgi:hypothetical protein